MLRRNHHGEHAKKRTPRALYLKKTQGLKSYRPQPLIGLLIWLVSYPNKEITANRYQQRSTDRTIPAAPK